MAYCIGCEIEQPVETKFDDWVYAWYFASTFFSALFRLHRCVLVPLGSLLCLLGAQPLGGMSIEACVGNEWPFIVIVGTPLFSAVFLAGKLLRSGFEWYSPRAERLQ